MRRTPPLLFALIAVSVALPAWAQEAQPTPAAGGQAGGTQTGAQAGAGGQGGGQTGAMVSILAAPEVMDSAFAALDAGEYDGAVRQFTLAILFNPTYIPAYIGRAIAYSGQGDEDSAALDFDRAVQFAGDDPARRASVLASRGDFRQQTGDLEGATDDYTEAIALDPDAQYFIARAILYVTNDDPERAGADLDSAVENLPADATQAAAVYETRARFRTATNDLEGAIADYTEAIGIQSTRDRITTRATLYAVAGQGEEALADVNGLISAQPDDATLYLVRAYVQLILNDDEAATLDYARYAANSGAEQREGGALADGETRVVAMAENVGYVFVFTAERTQPVTITAEAEPGTEVDPLIIVFDSEGTPLTADDDSGGASQGSNRVVNARVYNLRVPADGQYFAYVTHALGGATGQVAVTLQAES